MSVAKDIAEQAAKEAVRSTFEKLGVNTEDPESVEAFQADLRFNRGLRKRAEQGTNAFFQLVFLAIAGAIVTAVAKYLHIGQVQ